MDNEKSLDKALHKDRNQQPLSKMGMPVTYPVPAPKSYTQTGKLLNKDDNPRFTHWFLSKIHFLAHSQYFRLILPCIDS